MKNARKNRLGTLLTSLTVGVVLLALLLSACQGKAITTEDIEAVVQATDGQEVVLTLPDGSRVRVEAEKQIDDAGNLVGAEVKAKIKVGDDNPKLVEIEKSSVQTAGDLTGQQAPEDFHFSGVIESMGADTWVVGGRSFMVNAATILDSGLAVGVQAEVEFIMLSGGSLLATEIETPAGAFAAATGQPEVAEDFSLTGVIGSLSANELVLGGKNFKIDANTVLDNGLAAGVLARVEFVVQADGSFLALEVETDATETLIAGTPLDEGENFYFAGPIQSMSATAWVIGGKTFAVTPATLFDEGLALGVNANVEFIIGADGSLQAVHIEQTGFEFTGLVQAVGADAYTIGGRIFKVNAVTLIDQGLKVRKMAQVDFLIQSDGSLLALKIKTAKTKVQGFTFKGVTQSLSATAITVTGETFQVGPATSIGAGVASGVEVNVTFDIKPGNILSAISVQNAKDVQKN